MFADISYPALWLAVAVFFVSAALAWGFRRFQVTDSVGLIAVLVLPVAAYGIASGFVAKITLPGGWGAEFRQVAAAKVTPAPLVAEVQDVSIIEKGGVGAIGALMAGLVPGKPVAISLRLGRQGYYNKRAIAEYARAFLRFDPDLTVIFVTEAEGRFVASANGNAVLAAAEVEDFDNRLLGALEAGDLATLRQVVVLTTATVSQDTTNADALARMVQDGVDAIIKVDATGKAVGVVRRDEIMTQLMIRLAAG